MKITGILVLVAIMSLAGVFSEEGICGTQPLKKEDWTYVATGNRIVNGMDSHVGEWPWQVMVEFNSNDSSDLCGGSLITENHILTAAGCSTPDDTEWKVRVVLGAHSRTNTEETHRIVREVLKSIIHEQYDGSKLINDVQIIFLDKPVEFTDYIRPICFPKPDEDFSEKTAWVTGWGRTHESNETSEADVLQKVAVSIWTDSRCGALGGSKEPASTLCTGRDEEKDFIMGESGGPLVMQRPDGHWTQVGVISYAVMGCANPQDCPSVYMRVTHYRDWIEKQINTKLFDD